MTPDEWAKIATYLGAAVGKEMPPGQVLVYYDLLRDLPAEAVWAAARAAICESAYPTVPPVGILRQRAAQAPHGQAPEWGEAWGLVCRAVRRWGLDRQRQALESLPAAARAAAESVGWRALCDADPGDLDTLRAQFRDVYGQAKGRGDREALLPPAVRRALGEAGRGVGLLPDGRGG